MFLVSSLCQDLTMLTTSVSLPGEGKYIEILFSLLIQSTEEC